MLFWRTPSNVIIKSHFHVHQFQEPSPTFEWDTCFNCGGEFLIERGSFEFGFEKSRCQVCGGTGETLVGYPNITFLEWIRLDIRDVIVYGILDGQINLQFPG